MTGFFSSKTANHLTSASNHYIDWSRVGELLNSARHRYTQEELLQRGAILAASGYGAYEGYRLSDEGLGVKSGLYSMAGCFVGFVISHTAVILPLIYKRWVRSQECHTIENTIINRLQTYQQAHPNNISQQLSYRIPLLVNDILTLSLSDDKHARASQTWGKRLCLMKKVDEKLQEHLQLLDKNPDNIRGNDITQFWSQDSKTLCDVLSNPAPTTSDNRPAPQGR